LRKTGRNLDIRLGSCEGITDFRPSPVSGGQALGSGARQGQQSIDDRDPAPLRVIYGEPLPHWGPIAGPTLRQGTPMASEDGQLCESPSGHHLEFGYTQSILCEGVSQKLGYLRFRGRTKNGYCHSRMALASCVGKVCLAGCLFSVSTKQDFRTFLAHQKYHL
jgi:hypothetical protein